MTTYSNTNTPDPSEAGDQPATNESAEIFGRTATDALDTDASGARATDETNALEVQKDRYLRLAAEYDNYRKRTAKELQQAGGRGQAEVIRLLLTSLDDLSRFAHLDPATADAATVVHGVALVEKNVLKALTDLGLEIIDPVELLFDPNLHEAVSTQAAESPDEDHMVAQVYQRGYMLNGQLLRPARVAVKQY